LRNVQTITLEIKPYATNLGTEVAVPLRSPLGRKTHYLHTYYGSTGNNSVLHHRRVFKDASGGCLLIDSKRQSPGHWIWA